MKILVVTEQWFPDYTGGSGRVATDTSLALGRLGHEITVVSPSLAGAPRVSKPGIGVTLRRTVERPRMLPQTLTDPFRFREAIQEAEFDADVIVSHQPSGTWAASHAAPDVPCVNVFHASGYREAKHRRVTAGLGLTGRFRSRTVEPILGRLEPLNLRHASAILVLSDFSKGLIEADHPWALNKVHVVPGGVDVGHFCPSFDRQSLRVRLGIDDGQVVFVTVRRLVARTGVGLLLEAFASIAKLVPHSRLVVVGDGELREELETRARDAGLDSRILFVGRVSDEEVLNWYQAADLFVLPTTAYEGFGMSTAESLACGTPVVGTPIGATPSILAPLEMSWISDEATPESLGSSAVKAVAGGALERRDECRSYAELNLSIEAMAVGWESVLQAVSSEES